MPALFDNHGRKINYLRIAVTDRCNLRCFYCMPEEGIQYLPKKELLTFEEILRIVTLLASMGIEKVRITGGEPFVRRDIMDLIRALSKVAGIQKLNLTTNGTLTRPYIAELKDLGLTSVNLSLDALDPECFFRITRRDCFDEVMATFQALIGNDIETKINTVVMAGKNDSEIIPLVDLARDHPIGVRFIEEMPFNGKGQSSHDLPWNHLRILEEIRRHYPGIEKIPDPPSSTAANYRIPSHAGTVGIIAAYTRTFCGTCNRLRLTAQGLLKTCLYDQGVFQIRDLLREGISDEQLRLTFLEALGNRARDGFEAEARRSGSPVSESMATIGG